MILLFTLPQLPRETLGTTIIFLPIYTDTLPLGSVYTFPYIYSDSCYRGTSSMILSFRLIMIHMLSAFNVSCTIVFPFLLFYYCHSSHLHYRFYYHHLQLSLCVLIPFVVLFFFLVYIFFFMAIVRRVITFQQDFPALFFLGLLPFIAFYLPPSRVLSLISPPPTTSPPPPPLSPHHHISFSPHIYNFFSPFPPPPLSTYPSYHSCFLF